MTHDQHFTGREGPALGKLRRAAAALDRAIITAETAFRAACEERQEVLEPAEFGNTGKASEGVFLELYETTVSAWEKGFARAALVVCLSVAGLGLGADPAKADDCPRPERIFVTGPNGTKAVLGANSLVDWLYSEGSARAVIDSGKCTCANRYPSWEAAVAWFERDYSNLGEAGIQDALSAAGKRAMPLSETARQICREQGGAH